VRAVAATSLIAAALAASAQTPLPPGFAPTGSPIASASDMARYLDMLLAEGPDLAIALAAAGMLLCVPLIWRALRR
jgi:hypothetical protein